MCFAVIENFRSCNEITDVGNKYLLFLLSVKLLHNTIGSLCPCGPAGTFQSNEYQPSPVHVHHHLQQHQQQPHHQLLRGAE